MKPLLCVLASTSTGVGRAQSRLGRGVPSAVQVYTMGKQSEAAATVGEGERAPPVQVRPNSMCLILTLKPTYT
jgi:hypothetical protein